MKCKSLMTFLCVAGLFGCASSHQLTDLDQRITRLEQQNAALESVLKEAAQTADQLQSDLTAYQEIREKIDLELRSQSAEMYAAVEYLQKELQVVTGKLEEADYSIQKSRLSSTDVTKEKENRVNRIEEISRLNKDRIARIEQYLDFETSIQDLKQRKDGPGSAAGKGKKTLSEKELYGVAKQALDKGEFEVAREQFLQFLKRFPQSKNADNAQFWIGEIYFREKWYEKAIMEYQKVIETYPDGNKVPSALLKQGLAFFSLDEKANAKLILKEMIRKYPASNEAKIAKEKLKSFQ